jgi:hypothetical protein
MQNGRQSIWKVCEIHFLCRMTVCLSFVLRDESYLQACHIAVKTSKKREIEEGDQCFETILPRMKMFSNRQHIFQRCILFYTEAVMFIYCRQALHCKAM